MTRVWTREWHDAPVALFEIENPWKRTAVSTGVFTALIFIGNLLLNEGSVLGRLVRALVVGALYGAVVLWMNLRADRKQRSRDAEVGT